MMKDIFLSLIFNIKKNYMTFTTKSVFAIDFFKLRNNAVLRKTVGNVKNHRSINLIRPKQEAII